MPAWWVPVAVMWLALTSPALADYRFEYFDVSDGLLQSRILAVAEDSQGRMWVGTEAGINLYDGYEFSELHRIDPNHAHVTRSTIFGLYGQRAGEMWVATARGVSRVDLASKEVTDIWHFQAHLPANLGRYRQAQFIETCDGSMLVARSRQVFHLVITPEGVQQTLLLSADDANSIPIDISAFAMTKDEAGTVWISDASRLWQISCDQPELRLVQDRGTFEGDTQFYVGLVVDDRGHVFWASDRGVSVIDRASGDTLGQFSVDQLYDPGTELLGIAGDGSGGILAMTDQGLDRWVWEQGISDAQGLSILDIWVPNDSEPAMSQSRRAGLQAALSGDGLIWTISAHGGVAFNPREAGSAKWVQDPKQPEIFSRLRVNPQTGLYVDRFGVVWFFGGLNGISLYSPEKHRFQTLQNPSLLRRSARSLEFVEVDGQSFLWVSWDGGELSLWQKNAGKTFERVTAFDTDELQSQSRSLGTVRAMARGNDGLVWLATPQSIWLADTRAQSIQHVHTFEQLAGDIEASRYANIGLIYDPVRQALFYSHSNEIWMLSLNAGDDKVTAEHLDWLSLSPLLGAYVSLGQLQDGRLAIGSTQGLRVANLEAQAWVDHPLGSGTGADPREVVISMAQDPKGRIWLGTRSGLGLYSLSNDSQVLDPVVRWQRADGLADDTIYALAITDDEEAWVSTNRGLVQLTLDPSDAGEAMFRSFGMVEGLPNYEFNGRALTKDNEGSLYFGGVNGIAWFDPSLVRPHPRAPDVMLRSLSVNEEPWDIGVLTPSLDLSYQENSLAIAYTGMHFSARNKNQYAYQLEGHESSWVSADKERTARYSNLRPGEYRFWVKAANLDGVWSEPKLLFEANIAPPPWATPWAYALYVALMVMAVGMMVWSSERRRHQLEALVAQRTQELGEKNKTIEAQALQLEEALEARTLFFANISHEFRTPLTLIQTAVEQLDTQNKHPKASQLAKHYIQRLTRLVDQLLDLSRLRLSGVEKASKPWSLNRIVALTLEGFEYLAKERGINLTLEMNDEFRTQVDQASVEKILLNLLTNAFKYTPSGGSVLVSLASSGQSIQIDIKDTGPGIAADKQQLIFQRFERIPSEETLMREGAGIGLALVKEAARAIGGSIDVSSTLGQGSTFSVRIPGWVIPSYSSLDQDQPSVTYLSGTRLQLDRALLSKSASAENLIDGMDQPDGAQHDRTVLVVEDNPDLRRYLAELLSEDWRVHQASDGLKAMEVLEKEDVDVVLADIMMPHMDGLALLERVRDNMDTSHIPFLLLSARHDTETRLKGLTLAADDFLTKPFSPEELKLKLRNVVLARELLRSAILRTIGREAFGDDEAVAAGEDAFANQDGHLSPRDHKFLERLNAWMAEHCKDPDWSVATMADQLAVNERTLQRKIRALTGMTPVNFVTQYRLSQAKAYLQNPSLTIQEIAFDLGFGSQQSFSRAFKQAFAMTPSQWRQDQR